MCVTRVRFSEGDYHEYKTPSFPFIANVTIIRHGVGGEGRWEGREGGRGRGGGGGAGGRGEGVGGALLVAYCPNRQNKPQGRIALDSCTCCHTKTSRESTLLSHIVTVY